MPHDGQTALKDRTTRRIERSRSVLSHWLASHAGDPAAAILKGTGPHDGHARTLQIAAVDVAGLLADLQRGNTVQTIVPAYYGQRLVAEALK
jgi:hypothetical protein